MAFHRAFLSALLLGLAASSARASALEHSRQLKQFGKGKGALGMQTTTVAVSAPVTIGAVYGGYAGAAALPAPVYINGGPGLAAAFQQPAMVAGPTYLPSPKDKIAGALAGAVGGFTNFGAPAAAGAAVYPAGAAAAVAAPAYAAAPAYGVPSYNPIQYQYVPTPALVAPAGAAAAAVAPAQPAASAAKQQDADPGFKSPDRTTFTMRIPNLDNLPPKPEVPKGPNVTAIVNAFTDRLVSSSQSFNSAIGSKNGTLVLSPSPAVPRGLPAPSGFNASGKGAAAALASLAEADAGAAAAKAATADAAEKVKRAALEAVARGIQGHVAASEALQSAAAEAIRQEAAAVKSAKDSLVKHVGAMRDYAQERVQDIKDRVRQAAQQTAPAAVQAAPAVVLAPVPVNTVVSVVSSSNTMPAYTAKPKFNMFG